MPACWVGIPGSGADAQVTLFMRCWWVDGGEGEAAQSQLPPTVLVMLMAEGTSLWSWRMCRDVPAFGRPLCWRTQPTASTWGFLSHRLTRRSPVRSHHLGWGSLGLW